MKRRHENVDPMLAVDCIRGAPPRRDRRSNHFWLARTPNEYPELGRGLYADSRVKSSIGTSRLNGPGLVCGAAKFSLGIAKGSHHRHSKQGHDARAVPAV